MDYFMVLSQQLLEETKKSPEEHQSGQPVVGQIFAPEVSRIRRGGVNICHCSRTGRSRQPCQPGSVVLHTLEYRRIEQIKLIVNQLHPAQHRHCQTHRAGLNELYDCAGVIRRDMVSVELKGRRDSMTFQAKMLQNPRLLTCNLLVILPFFRPLVRPTI